VQEDLDAYGAKANLDDSGDGDGSFGTQQADFFTRPRLLVACD